MTAPVGRWSQMGAERRRSDLARVDDMVIKTTRVCGFESILGDGEATVELHFPVIFTEKPSMSGVGELEEGQAVEAGNFPTCSMMPIAWARTHEDRVGGGLNAPGWYVGVTLAVVTTGRAGHRVVLHWQAEGKAIRDPALRQPPSPGEQL